VWIHKVGLRFHKVRTSVAFACKRELGSSVVRNTHKALHQQQQQQQQYRQPVCAMLLLLLLLPCAGMPDP
jgi:hypothetical protein